jgi:hypothetical protein
MESIEDMTGADGRGRRGFLAASAVGAAAAALLATPRDAAAQATGSGFTTFVFDPNSPPDLNRYSDWALLMEAVGAAPHGTKEIRIECTLADRFRVPPGTWDLNGATLEGRGTPTATGISFLEFGDGTYLTNPGTLFLSHGMYVRTVSTTPIMTIVDDRMIELFGDVAVFSDRSPFFHVETPADRLVVFAIETGPGFSDPRLHAQLAPATFSPSVHNAGTRPVVVGLQKSTSDMSDGTLSGPGGFVMLTLTPTAGVTVGQGPDEPAFRTGYKHPQAAFVVELNYNRAFNIALNPIPALAPASLSVEDAIIRIVAAAAVTEMVAFGAAAAKKPIVFSTVDLQNAVIEIRDDTGVVVDAKAAGGWRVLSPTQLSLLTPASFKTGKFRAIAVGKRQAS